MAASTEVVAQHSLQHHFANMEQQRESTTLGMWIFLVTEIMFFGGLFAAYLIFRFSIQMCGTSAASTWSSGSAPSIPSSCCAAVDGGARRFTPSNWDTPSHCHPADHHRADGIAASLGSKAVEYHNHWVEGSFPGPFWHMDTSRLHGMTSSPPSSSSSSIS